MSCLEKQQFTTYGLLIEPWRSPSNHRQETELKTHEPSREAMPLKIEEV
jgi:hypothetical protein